MTTWLCVSAALLRELAVAASADPRSVQRVLRGETVRGMADGRIRRVLAERGIEPRRPCAPQRGPERAA